MSPGAARADHEGRAQRVLGPAQALTFSLPMYFGFSFGLVQADVI